MLLEAVGARLRAAADEIRRADTAGLSVVFQLVRRLVIAGPVSVANRTRWTGVPAGCAVGLQ